MFLNGVGIYTEAYGLLLLTIPAVMTAVPSGCSVAVAGATLRFAVLLPIVATSLLGIATAISGFDSPGD